MQTFWTDHVRPLFDDDCLNYQVTLANGSYARYVNLDNAATTSPFKEVRLYVEERLRSYGSVHRGAGQKSKITTREYDATRDTIRRFTGSSAGKYVIFAKNTTEAINHTSQTVSRLPGKILVSDIEHSSNLLPWMMHNEVVQYRTRPDGSVDLDEVESILRTHATGAPDERIKLLTTTGASTITGYKPPIHELARIAHQNGAQMFADVCQLVQHESVDMRPEDDPGHLDYLAFSGHKMYAPYGTGVLIGPKEVFDRFMPYQIGGGNLPYITGDLEIKRFYTERAHDPGTPNAMGALSISKAVEVFERIGRDRIAAYEHFLVSHVHEQMKGIPGVQLHVNGSHLGHVIPFDLQGFDGRLVAEILAEEHGIGLRAGAFCTYEYIRKLKRISPREDQKIAEEVDRGITRNIPTIIRASFAVYNTMDDCTRFLAALKEISGRGPTHYQHLYSQDEASGAWTRRAV